MKAFKYRTVENLHFVFDIIFNRRLYCCTTECLNDIREADVRVGNDRGRETEILEFGLAVTRELHELRVCSLSKSFKNHLLWAHYAGGYTGVAIEVELKDDEIAHVTYDDNFIFLSDLIQKNSAEEAAREVLSRKYKAWSHEEEVRLIVKSEFHRLDKPISRTIVGSRTSPALVSALYLICSHFGIVLERMVVADWGIYTVGAQPVS
jgi:hypothetical protein